MLWNTNSGFPIFQISTGNENQMKYLGRLGEGERLVFRFFYAGKCVLNYSYSYLLQPTIGTVLIKHELTDVCEHVFEGRMVCSWLIVSRLPLLLRTCTISSLTPMPPSKRRGKKRLNEETLNFKGALNSFTWNCSY